MIVISVFDCVRDNVAVCVEVDAGDASGTVTVVVGASIDAPASGDPVTATHWHVPKPSPVSLHIFHA